METSIIYNENTAKIAEFSIIHNIHEIRGLRVILDLDLARMYHVETRVLNQSVKRNIKRFPDDFMFQLTKEEWESMSSQFVMTSGSRRPKSSVPYAFTEQGIAMLSGLLNSDIAIDTNIRIMRAFVMLRQYVLSYAELKQDMESFKTETKEQINDIYEVLDELISHKKELEKPSNPIGFVLKKE